MKVSFLARDRERTVPMYIPDIFQNDRDEKLNREKFTLIDKNETFTVTNYTEYLIIYFYFIRQYLNIHIRYYIKLYYTDAI